MLRNLQSPSFYDDRLVVVHAYLGNEWKVTLELGISALNNISYGFHSTSNVDVQGISVTESSPKIV